MMNGFGRGYGYGRGFNVVGPVLCMLVMLALIGLVVYLVLKNRNLKNNLIGTGGTKASIGASGLGRAMEILNEKFALGEITEEEYSRKKELLNS